MDTIKYTLISDVSFYEAPVDFAKMKSAGVKGTIIRAGQNLWVDPSFKTFWYDAKNAGLPRGSYWFYDSRIEPKTQAELWVKTVGEDFGELPFVFDIEESYNGAFKGSSNWIIFLEHLKTLINGHEIKLYSGYYFFKDNCKESDKLYFKQYGNPWLADYDSEPMVPYPFDDWEIWQFTDKGSGDVYGCEGGAVDLNYFKGTETEFIKRFNIPDMTIPPVIPNDPDLIKTHEGVTLHKIQRFGTTCYVHIIEPKKARIFVIPRYNFGTVKNAVTKYKAQVGINGGGWPQPSITGVLANEVWYSDGVAINTKAKDFRGYINVSKTGELKIYETSTLGSNLWNCWGFDRILVSNGQFNTKISDRYTKDARTGTGITSDGKLILLSAEGNDYHQQGLSFPEMANILIEFGAIFGGNCDGGSSTQAINTGISENSLFVGSDGSDANVINHVLVYATPLNNGEIEIPEDPEIPIPEQPTGENMIYTMKTISSDTRIRDQHNTLGNNLASVNANVVVTGTEKFIATSQLSNTGGVYQMVGDIWIKISYNGVTGWMAIVHLGKPICSNLVESGVVVPPTVTIPKPTEVIVTLDNGDKYSFTNPTKVA